MDKVFTFQKVKAGEIIRRIKASEKQVEDIVRRKDEADRSSRRRRSTTGGTLDDGPSEDEFEILEEELSDIIADVHDLAKYTQLNYTGFQKIIKKHDVRFRCPSKSLADSNRNKLAGRSSRYSLRD